MRVPLLRAQGDPTPIAWWEWLAAPIALPLYFVGFLLLAPFKLFLRPKVLDAASLKPKLAAAGRVMEWDQIESHLRAGKGTLIIEHCSPRGPIREWWTPDDLSESAPVTLPTSLYLLPDPAEVKELYAYARRSIARYVDLKTGKAKLTQVPPPAKPDRTSITIDLGDGAMTDVVVPLGRHLADQFPKARIVTLLAWSEDPLLFDGDAEMVFQDLAVAEVDDNPDADD